MRTKAWIAIVGALVGVALGGSIAVAGAGTRSVNFRATLNVAQEVMPKEKGAPSNASGHFSATLTGTNLKWALTFSHLSGPALAAHIHLGPRGKSGPVLIPLCAPCKSPASGSVKVTQAEIKDMTAGKTYANVHTVKNANGEIRGQIS